MADQNRHQMIQNPFAAALHQNGYEQAFAGQIGQAYGASMPKELSLAASLNTQAEFLAKAEEALRGALTRIRGTRPEPAPSAQGPTTAAPSLITRSAQNATAAAVVCGLASSIAELLSDG